MLLPKSLRRPWPLWLVFACFAVTVVSVPLVCHQRRPQPHNMTELVERIEESHRDWHIIGNSPSYGTRDGFFLSRKSASWEALAALPLDPSQARRWDGVVLCRNANANDEVAVWGQGAFVYGEFVFFGDPLLIEEIKRSLGAE